MALLLTQCTEGTLSSEHVTYDVGIHLDPAERPTGGEHVDRDWRDHRRLVYLDPGFMAAASAPSIKYGYKSRLSARWQDVYLRIAP